MVDRSRHLSRITAMTGMVCWGSSCLAGLPTDLNGDGVVDLLDHASFVTCLAGPSDPPPCLTGDVTQDGNVDLLDWSLLQGGFGACSAAWTDGLFSGSGSSGIRALVEFDDGTGPALYAGVQYFTGSPSTGNRIARWDGEAWSTLSGMGGTVYALAVFDDGTGPALYAAGSFVSAGGVSARYVAKWDGGAWLPLGSGTNSWVLSLIVFDDGCGPALYAGGAFSTAGDVSASRIAKWNGSDWSPLGSGTGDSALSGAVYSLVSFDDGTGPALHAGGEFAFAGGLDAYGIAKWDGTSWHPLGSGPGTPGGLFEVRALTVFDDGTGPALYAGGNFVAPDFVAMRNVAKWDGSAWSSLGAGVGTSLFNTVYSLEVHDDGTGPALFAAGYFNIAGGVPANHIARWNGTTWNSLATGIAGPTSTTVVRSLATFDDGTGPALFAAGVFDAAGDVAADNLAKWSGVTWAPVGGGMNAGVLGLATSPEKAGATLYAGGDFTAAGGVLANHVAEWDGATWSSLGDGVNGPVHALTAIDEGTGLSLYVGGGFTAAGGAAANRIAMWDGNAWHPLDVGMGPPGALVHSLAAFDDGTGLAVYAAGNFTRAGGAPANRIAKWRGDDWLPLGSGIGGTFPNNAVFALAVFDDGEGARLYAGGNFFSAGGASANRIARWDGGAWSPLGSGIGGNSFDTAVRALIVFDDGTGPALYVAGNFTSAGGVPASHLAKWDGNGWIPLGFGADDEILALAVVDDASGPMLCAGGRFTQVGDTPANRIARWDGAAWSPLGTGLSDISQNAVAFAITGFGDLAGPALYAGGLFSRAGDQSSTNIGRWACGD